jgi:hypothetical protein
LVPRCRKPYYLHSLSRIYLSKHVYYLELKIGSQVKHPVTDFDIFTLGYFTTAKFRTWIKFDSTGNSSKQSLRQWESTVVQNKKKSEVSLMWEVKLTRKIYLIWLLLSWIWTSRNSVVSNKSFGPEM